MIKKIKNLDDQFNEIIKIYNSVGWVSYTKNLDNFKKGLKNSSYLYGYFKEDKLIGMIRGLTDYASIHYIQDIIIDKDFHNNGIGSELVNYVLGELSCVRGHVLLTDDDESQLAFYKKLKFHNTKELKNIPLNAFVQYKDTDLS